MVTPRRFVKARYAVARCIWCGAYPKGLPALMDHFAAKHGVVAPVAHFSVHAAGLSPPSRCTP